MINVRQHYFDDLDDVATRIGAIADLIEVCELRYEHDRI